MPAIGQFALVRGYDNGLLNGEVKEVVKVTAKLFYSRQGTYRDQQFRLDNLIASFNTKEDAERLRDSLAGIKGEMDRRIAAARKSANDAALSAIARATPVSSRSQGDGHA